MSSPALTDNHRFPKSCRLLNRGDFDRVYQEGVRRSNAHFAAICRKTGGNVPGRVGLAVGRVIGGAVVRNRVKRLLREAVRTCLGKLPNGCEVVLQARRGITNLSASELNAEVQRIFNLAATGVFSEKTR